MWIWLMSLAFAEQSERDSAQQKVQELRPQPFQIGVQPDVFWSVGGTSGLSLSSNNGVYAGVETSLSRVNGNRLIGLATDAIWDSGLQGVSATVGPRVGLLMFAMDGGVSIRSDFVDPVETGGQLRVLLNLGFGTVYYRTGFWPNTDELSTVHQLGMSLKFPQMLGTSLFYE